MRLIRSLRFVNYEAMHALSTRHLCGILILGLLLCACRSERTYQAVRPTAAPYQPLPALPLSAINIPISLDLHQLERLANRGTPLVLVDDDRLAQRDGHRLYATRGQFDFRAGNGGVHWSLPIQFEASKKVDFLGSRFSCEGRFLQPFETAVRVSPDWQLTFHTRAGPRLWEQPCQVKSLGGAADGIITAFIDRELDQRLPAIVSNIDDNLNKIGDVRALVSQAWETIQRPIQVNSASDAWLHIRPRQINVGELGGRGNAAYITVGIDAQMALSRGAPDTSHHASSLPAAFGSTVSDSFRLALQADIPYREAGELLSTALAGRAIDVQGRSVTIERLLLAGSGSRLYMETELSGDFRGTVYMTGIPRYRPETQTIAVDSLRYDMESQALLTRVAAWLLDDRIGAALRNAAVWPVASEIETARHLFTKGLNRPLGHGLQLSGEISALTPGQVYVTANGLTAFIEARGTARLMISKLPL